MVDGDIHYSEEQRVQGQGMRECSFSLFLVEFISYTVQKGFKLELNHHK